MAQEVAQRLEEWRRQQVGWLDAIGGRLCGDEPTRHINTRKTDRDED